MCHFSSIKPRSFQSLTAYYVYKAVTERNGNSHIVGANAKLYNYYCGSNVWLNYVGVQHLEVYSNVRWKKKKKKTILCTWLFILSYSQEQRQRPRL